MVREEGYGLYVKFVMVLITSAMYGVRMKSYLCVSSTFFPKLLPICPFPYAVVLYLFTKAVTRVSRVNKWKGKEGEQTYNAHSALPNSS